jgi:hypothetical protein
LRERDLRLASLGLLRRFRPRRGVEQRELRHALRRLLQHGQGDVAAHGEPGERKARRRGSEDTRRDRIHVLVAGMVGDHDRSESPERGNLVGIEPRRAVQTGDEDDRERRVHLTSIFAVQAE